MEGFGGRASEWRSCGFVEENVQERFLFWSQDPHFTALASLLARLRLLAGLHGGPSNWHTEFQVLPWTYNLAAFRPRRQPETRPTLRPCPRPFSPKGPQPGPARYSPVVVRLATHIT